MKATLKLLSSQKETSKGYPICVELFFSSKKRPRKTIGYTKLEFWNPSESLLFKEHPNYYILHPIILEYKSKIAKINFGDYNFNEAKNILFGESKEESKVDFGYLAFFQIRVNEKIAKKESVDAYYDVKHVISEYIDTHDIPINDISYEWLNDFVLFKLSTGCEEGGVMSYLRTMRAVYKEAQRRTSLKIKQDNPFIGIIKRASPKPVINVPRSNIQSLIKYEPKKSTTVNRIYKRKRNLAIWMFQIYIGGHDYIDVALLKWSNINSRVKFQRWKLRNKPDGGVIVDNFLLPEALKIIKEYGNPKTDRVFSFIPDPVLEPIKYKKYRGNINRSLKKVSEQLGFVENIKTKSPRYIFRTYAGEILIHDLIVMKLQGHKPQGITFNYQGSISYSVLDESHKKVANYLLETE